MNESKDESKVTIKSSFLIGLIVFALILLITVVFLFGFLIGSGKNKQTIVTKIDEFTIGNSSGNKENITNTNAITQREDNFKQNKKNENLSTQKEEDKDTALKRLGFVPYGSKKKEESNLSSKSSTKEDNVDKRNLSALFATQNGNNSNYSTNSNVYSSNFSSSSSSSSRTPSSSNISSSQNYSTNNVSSESGKEAVKNYFMELELKLAGSKTWSDPNQFAEQLLKSAMSGDFSDLNELTTNMKRVANDISRMSVPAECAEHRDAVVNSLNDSISILNKVKRGINEGDMQIIMSLTAEADRIKASAGRSDELMKQLKLKYDI